MPDPDVDTAISFDDPVALAATVSTLDRPVLVGFDVDGVLAPIVAHADDAALLPGVLDAIADLAARTPVAVVSGRRLDDLLGFGFDHPVAVFGTHGLERHGVEPLELTASERARYDRLHTIAHEAATRAGAGAWVETKRAGVVLHVREATSSEAAARASEQARRRATDVTGAHVKPGKAVLELLARETSKATAMTTLRTELGAASIVFVGDDHTDEEVFASMRPGDLGVRVGPGTTAAQRRLAGPDDVLTLIRTLTNSAPLVD
ncbi:MAG: trehalose-phosphatase [Desertimonas sp.]